MEEDSDPETGECDNSTDHYLNCNICGCVCQKRHCKIVCPQCGVIRDCSDPFY